MRPLFTAFVLGSALVAAAAFAHTRLPIALLAVGAVAVGVLLAVLASASADPLTIVCGALGALAATWLAPSAPVLAGALLVSAAFVARSFRARTPRRRALHVGLSLAGAFAASACAMAYATSTTTARMGAILVAGVLAAAPLLVPVDEPMPFALDLAADDLDGGARVTLARAASLARRSAELRGALRADSRKHLDRSLRVVLALGRARALADGAAAEVIDRQLAAHVDEMERLFAAATEAGARTAGLGDTTLVAIRENGEQLASQASALAEVDAALAPNATFEQYDRPR